MTLHFLGDVDLIDEASLVEALAAVPVPELQLSIRSTAIWHDGVVVLLAEGTPALDGLRRDTGVAVAAAGRKSEPRWTPHMTLARHAGAAPAPAPAAIDPIIWAPREVSLVWSRRDAAGYEVVRAWPTVTG
ncbi:2'-5' RNA ligase family protein [Rhizobacter sp. OV335]|uniref:2'-5' RNA ligase family protein n=1 Tax=Rhizobacter sp. OV335 TaxID=1500264 RepID=UPI0009128310|nr:2'-5' RNA ligase family protein [Rhizobacter sp. OV335]SHM83934.1 2'-5' RNA ligase [Rhizobacter sp. OV335]